MGTFEKSVGAGMLIAIGCTVFLSCESKYIGALLFSVALCAICNLNLPLFTGRVCFLETEDDVKNLFVCLGGNLLGCAGASIVLGASLPDIAVAASMLCQSKLSQTSFITFILSIFCGIMMAVAVRTYKEQSGFGRYVGIFTCVPTFILCGFEHSIADIGYFFLTPTIPLKNVLWFSLLTIWGNFLGGLIFRKSEGTANAENR